MATAGAAIAAIVQAVKASGVLVRLDPSEFMKLLGHVPEPLIVTAKGGLFNTKYKYLLAYKGLAFYTTSSEPLNLPANADLIIAESIWMPN
jgi:hypothetical protein